MGTSFSKIDQNRLNLWLNYLLVSYAFLLPINDYARSFLLSIMVILILIRGNYKTYFAPVFKNQVVIAFIGFFLIYLISLIWTENIKEGASFVKSVKFALFLPLFLSFIDKRFALIIISAFLGGMFFSELLSYAIHFNLIPNQFYIGYMEIYKSAAVDDPSPFLHRALYGMALALSVAILVYRILLEKFSTIPKIITAVFIITMTLNLLITGGRIGYFLYVILLLFSLFLALGKKTFIPVIVVVIIIPLLGMVGYSFDGIFKSRIDESKQNIEKMIKDPMDFHGSIGERMGMWFYSVDVIKNNFIIGVGIGDGVYETRKNIPLNNDFLKSVVHHHNQYIQVLVGTGIIGLMIFLNIFVQIFRFNQRDKELRAIMLLVTAAISIALFTETFHLKFYFPLWIVLLSAGMASRQTISGDSLIQTSNLNAYIGLILLAWVIGISQ